MVISRKESQIFRRDYILIRIWMAVTCGVIQKEFKSQHITDRSHETRDIVWDFAIAFIVSLTIKKLLLHHFPRKTLVWSAKWAQSWVFTFYVFYEENENLNAHSQRKLSRKLCCRSPAASFKLCFRAMICICGSAVVILNIFADVIHQIAVRY